MDDLSFLKNCVLTSIPLHSGKSAHVLKQEKFNLGLSTIHSKMGFDYLLSLHQVPLVGLGDLKNLEKFHPEALFCHFYNPHRKEELFVVLPYDKNAPAVHTLSKLWRNSSWYESSLMQHSAIKFKDADPSKDPFSEPENLIKKNTVFLKDYKTKLLKWEQLPPQKVKDFNAFIKRKSGKIQKVFLKFDPQQKRRENLYETGGLSKSLKNLNCEDIFFYLASLKVGMENYLEKKPSELEQAFWILGLEYARVCSHIKSLETLFSHFKLTTPFSTFKKLKSLSCDTFDTIEKEKLNFQHITEIFVKNYHQFFLNCQVIEKELQKKKISKLKSKLSFGTFSRDLLSKYSVTGVLAKSAGLNIDARTSYPYYFYNELQFEVPLGSAGTAYDRVFVLYEEILQSIRIIHQVVENFPLENANCKSKSMDKMISDSPSLLVGHLIEKPSGFAGCYLQKNIRNTPETFKLRSADFNHAQLFSHEFQGERVRNLIPTLTSLSLSRQEIMT